MLAEIAVEPQCRSLALRDSSQTGAVSTPERKCINGPE
jgi:hypothetical protein